MALIFDTKVALFDRLKATVPAGTQCTFAEQGDTNRRRQVFLGSTTDDDMQSAAFRDGPKKPTNVTGYVEVHAINITPGDPVAAERGVYELRDAITDACSQVDRAAVKGLVDLRPESATVDTAETTDGAYSALTIRVRVRGRVMQ
jgi:hypothetical protein